MYGSFPPVLCMVGAACPSGGCTALEGSPAAALTFAGVTLFGLDAFEGWAPSMCRFRRLSSLAAAGVQTICIVFVRR
jgi:hypothetical protein